MKKFDLNVNRYSLWRAGALHGCKQCVREKACRRWVLIAIAVIAFSVASAGNAHAGIGPPKYDLGTEVTLKGVVEQIQQKGLPFRGKGVFVMLRTEQGTIKVIVGPAKYLAEHNFTLNEGEWLEVIGSKVKIQGGDAVLVRLIQKGEARLVMRNEGGDPKW